MPAGPSVANPRIETDAAGNRYLVTERPRPGWDRASDRAGAYASLLAGVFVLALFIWYAVLPSLSGPPDWRTIIILCGLFLVPAAALLWLGVAGLPKPVRQFDEQRDLIDDKFIGLLSEHDPELLKLVEADAASRNAKS